MSSFDPTPVLGDTIDGRYVLKREIARGAMSVIFEAAHRFTGRNVAIKILDERRVTDPASRERLLRESKLLTMARHPNIVSILDAGPLPNGQPYLVMEMLEGRSLEGVLTSRRNLPVTDTVYIARQVCEALIHSHMRGVVHRNVKPNNIFLSRNDVGVEVVKLIDFGLASVPPDFGPSSSKAAPRIQRERDFVGTPEYSPPEDFRSGVSNDPRRDLYALGIVMYECLTGAVPFPGTADAIWEAFSNNSAVSVLELRPDTGLVLGKFVDNAIAKLREHRFGDAPSFLKALVETTGLSGGNSKLLSFATPEQSPDPGAVSAQPNTPSYRRQHARAPYVTPARVVQENGIISDGRTEDISAGGLLLIVHPIWSHRDPVKVRFALPISGYAMTCEAVSRWSRSARNTHAMGLEFINLAPQAHEEIARYVQLMGSRE